MSKHFVAVVIALGLAGGLVRAGQGGFQQQIENMQSQWQAEQKSKGLTDRAKLFEEYPTPGLMLDAKPNPVQPGTGGGFTMRGKFLPGTTFLVENEGVTMTGGLSGGAYTGKLTTEPTRFPEFIRVWA